MSRWVDVCRWYAGDRHRSLVTVDSAAWALSISGFSVLRYLDVPGGVPWARTLTGIALAVGIQMGVGSLLWLYEGRHRVGSRDEAVALAEAFAATTAALTLISVVIFDRLLPISIPIASGAFALMLAAGCRLGWRMLDESAPRPQGEPALVLGAGSGGTQLISRMVGDPESSYLPIGLLDDDPAKRHLKVHGVPVLGDRSALASVVERTGARTLIIAIPSAPSELFRDIQQSATALGLKVKALPSMRNILDGQVGLHDLRDIDVTDLLGRRPVHTDLDACAGYLRDKRVLVTGAGGSIGSELCRQLVHFQPSALLKLDRDESALHALQLSMTGRALLDSEDVILADIRDRQALERVFSRHRPDVVFHAAALKHLPMLEQYQDEAWKTNVLGTANVLEAAEGFGCETFVNISTDKAANPCSVLGYSKRIAERLTADMARTSQGRYVSVRFGNVLGSRGSVLPAFADQISRGGPVTVTDREVTRYFMMIPEACELVIQAAAIGPDGEVLILDMGEPVSILAVAQKMIELSGRRDVEIVFTGLRTGEKLHEELFSSTEGQRSTSHELIDAAPVPPLEIARVHASSVDWTPATEPVRAVDLTADQARLAVM